MDLSNLSSAQSSHLATNKVFGLVKEALDDLHVFSRDCMQNKRFLDNIPYSFDHAQHLGFLKCFKEALFLSRSTESLYCSLKRTDALLRLGPFSGVFSILLVSHVLCSLNLRVEVLDRGFEVCTDKKYTNQNPLYMKYTSDAQGYFAGQRGYGYLSLESFVDNCRALNAGETTLDQLNALSMPTLDLTLEVTAILEAGRRSLDDKGAWVDVQDLMQNPDAGKPICFAWSKSTESYI